MSPEQCTGAGKVTDRADVYSLGVMLFEMLTGKPPFEAQTPSALMRQHVTKNLPPLPASIAPAVSTLLTAMLAKEPDSRPSMQQVVQRLDSLSQLETDLAIVASAASGQPRESRAKSVLVSAGLTVAVSLGF